MWMSSLMLLGDSGDSSIVQKLLKKHPCTLAQTYEVAHRYETTKRAANSVTQLMQSGVRTTEWRARAATLRECIDHSEDEDESWTTPPVERSLKPPKSSFKHW